jgi:hypothetical protein
MPNASLIAIGIPSKPAYECHSLTTSPNTPCEALHYFFIPKPVWAVGFALEQTLHVVALAVFSYVDFKVDSAYKLFLCFV